MADLQKMAFEPPELGGQIIERKALAEKLEVKRKAIFIQAPAGYGKTTSAALWAHSLKNRAVWLDFCKNRPFIDANLGERSVLVLDNFRSTVHSEILERLLKERLSKVVVLSRNRPPAWFDELIIKREADVIGESDLMFTAAEIKELFARYGKPLSSFRAEYIREYTGGWIALIMSVILFGDGANVFANETMDCFLGKYFISVIREFWYRPEKRFLLAAALPGYVDNGYCEAAAGKADGMEILSRLSEAAGFALSDTNGAYIYHPVFRGFLLSELKKDKTPANTELYRKAASYSMNVSCPRTALEIAVASGNAGIVEEILPAVCKLQNCNIGIEELSGLVIKLQKLISEKEPAENPALARTLMQLSVIIDEREEFDLLTMSYKIKEFADMSTSLFFQALTYNLPFLHKARHDYAEILPRPEEYINKARPLLEPLFGSNFALIEKLLIGGLLFEKNDLKGAYGIIAELEPFLENMPATLLFCYRMLKCEILFSQDKDRFALDTLRKTEAEVCESRSESIIQNFWAYRTKIALYRGDFVAASEWLERSAIDLDSSLTLRRSFQNLTTARALIVAGKIDTAVKFLNRLLDFSKKKFRTADVIEIMTISAACEWLTDKKKAACVLEEAVIIAGRQKLVRPIIAEGTDILPILEYSLNRMRLGYCSKELDGEFLLWLCILSSKTAKKSKGLFYTVQKKPVRLSKKQQYVLELLAENLTYGQIADKMDVKITTVRDHITKLYEKLGVSSSREALNVGRELRLI